MPPPASEPSIYILKNTEQQGPFPEAVLRTSVLRGAVDPDAVLAWHKDLPDWIPLGDVLGIRVPEIVSAAAPSPISTPIAPAASGAHGVGGWLLFFCISLTILRPVLFVASAFSQWSLYGSQIRAVPALLQCFIWESFATAFFAVVGLIGGILIWAGRPNGRDIARRVLVLCMIGVVIANIISLLILGDQFATHAFSTVVGSVFHEAFFFTVWWLYFLKSKRVLNTYGPLPA